MDEVILNKFPPTHSLLIKLESKCVKLLLQVPKHNDFHLDLVTCGSSSSGALCCQQTD